MSFLDWVVLQVVWGRLTKMKFGFRRRGAGRNLGAMDRFVCPARFWGLSRICFKWRSWRVRLNGGF